VEKAVQIKPKVYWQTMVVELETPQEARDLLEILRRSLEWKKGQFALPGSEFEMYYGFEQKLIVSLEKALEPKED
jgi:hypothetical protein